jgi:rare lipoprotein A
MRLLDERFVAVALIAALAGCGGHTKESIATTGQGGQGPEADYPMVLGDPFVVDGKLYTPADTFNYDEVGYAAVDTEGGTAVSASHRTLPLPSYIEVTSLETGRTILVRTERRGPLAGSHLIALSPGAMEQLGIVASSPVRVRRVNPPEQERAFLRRGERAAERMETPMTLVAVLKRKLPVQQGASALSVPETVLPMQMATAPVEPPRTPEAPEKPAVPVRTDKAQNEGFFVQAGAFSQKANAQRVAGRIDGSVASAGKLFAARTGPFANRGLAEASLAKVKHAGYSEARIFSAE